MNKFIVAGKIVKVFSVSKNLKLLNIAVGKNNIPTILVAGNKATEDYQTGTFVEVEGYLKTVSLNGVPVQNLLARKIVPAKKVLESFFPDSEGNRYETKNTFSLEGKVNSIRKNANGVYTIGLVASSHYVETVYYKDSCDIKADDKIKAVGVIQTARKVYEDKPRFFENFVLIDISKD